MDLLLRKWNALPESAKASLAFGISTLILRGVNFLTTPIFTRVMDQVQYGIVAVYNSWISIIEVFAVIGLTSAGVFNVGLNEYNKDREVYVSTCVFLCNIITILVFSVIYVASNFLNGKCFDNVFLLAMFVHFLFYPAQFFFITRERYEYKYKLAIMISVFSVIISQGLSLYAVLYSGIVASTAKILGSEIGLIIVAVPVYILVLNKGNYFLSKKIAYAMLALAVPLIPHYLAQHVMTSADKIMISHFVSQSDSAIYSVVMNIGMILSVIWNAINGSLVPYTFEKLNNNNLSKITKIINKLVFLFLCFCLFVALIAPEVLKLLAPPKYYEGLKIMPFIVCVAFFNSLYNIYANIEFYFKKTTYIAYATIIASLVNLVANYFLIPIWGYVGASVATFASYIVLVIMNYYGYRKCCNCELYDNTFIIKCAIGSIFFMYFTSLVYIWNIVRYLFLIAIILAIVCKKNSLRKYII